MVNLIKLNVKAPEFNLIDIYNRRINLDEYKGRKVLIAFFRHAGCPYCNMRAHFFRKNYEQFNKQNLDLIFFFESTELILKSSIFHQEISPIPIISDPDKIWYETYGIENSLVKSVKSHLTTFIKQAITAKKNGVPIHPMKNGESFSTMPAEFLLDENLIIRRIHYSKNLSNRLSFDQIQSFLDD